MRHQERNFADATELERAMRWELTFLGYASVGPEWNDTQPAMTGPIRCFLMVESGEATLTTGAQSLTMRPGHLYYVPRDLPTARRCPARLTCYYGFFSCRDAAGQNLLTKQLYPLELGTWDERAMGPSGQTPRLISQQLYVKILMLSRLLAAYPELPSTIDGRRTPCSRFAQSLSFISENLSANIRVDTLAKMEGLSRNAFTRAFKDAIGSTPRSYLNRELNQKACRMILTSELSIRRIAELLGFRDEYYFNRFFSKMNGMPPLRYRNTLI